MTQLSEVLGVLEAWCGQALSDGQRAVYMQALTGYPVETVADVLVSWQKRNAPRSKMPAPGDVANACREAMRGTWQQEKAESPTFRDLERSAKTPRAVAALAFMRAMVADGRTPESKREAAKKFRAVYGDTYTTVCRERDCPGRGPTGGCKVHARKVEGPWVAMSEGVAFV